LLSPVFETRTPSPTASRQQDIQKPVNGTNSQGKENHHHHRRGSHNPKQASAHKESTREGGRGNHQKGSSQGNEKSHKPNQLSTNNAGTWQPSSSKRNKKKKGKSSEPKPAGQALPEGERKGG
jgi:hypothetical protein